MRKTVLLCVLLAGLLVGCGTVGVLRGWGPNFDANFLGSRHTDDNKFVLKYEVLNEGCTTELKLNAGDVVKIEVENTAGTTDLLIRAGEDTLYDGKDLEKESCEVTVEKDGTYLISASGQNAAGKLSVVREKGKRT